MKQSFSNTSALYTLSNCLGGRRPEVEPPYQPVVAILLFLFLYLSGMRFFRNFPEFRNFYDLRGRSRGNPRSGLIFMGGGGVVVNSWVP